MTREVETLKDRLAAEFPCDPVPVRKLRFADIQTEELEFLFDKRCFARRYDEVDIADYVTNVDSLFFLEGEFFRYYLAGFILAILASETARTEVVSPLSRAIASARPISGFDAPRLDCLTTGQIEVIRDVLLWCDSINHDDHDLARAIALIERRLVS
jgi:hypothetical protein